MHVSVAFIRANNVISNEMVVKGHQHNGPYVHCENSQIEISVHAAFATECHKLYRIEFVILCHFTHYRSLRTDTQYCPPMQEPNSLCIRCRIECCCHVGNCTDCDHISGHIRNRMERSNINVLLSSNGVIFAILWLEIGINTKWHFVSYFVSLCPTQPICYYWYVFVRGNSFGPHIRFKWLLGE